MLCSTLHSKKFGSAPKCTLHRNLQQKIQEFTFPAPSVQNAENIPGHRKSDVLLTADQGNILNIGMDKADGVSFGIIPAHFVVCAYFY
ncbi:hypothetical protein JD844_017146 [Phrynosoma platyrhinos]|uniref:Uncharacterized protein n=1 Tax=Phrynosoma platyrhinos TaxID=52577 RepID=A0ABQ7SLG1_PHRPL|nr:hypothetical protein JD844_017146 [Phrynosoma platyrhinos]